MLHIFFTIFLHQTLSIDEPSESAPKITRKLPKVTKPKDNELLKLEVKVEGQPKPDVKWFKQGEELFPSEEYQIENLEDGTSILFINNVYEDDTGEITFEAHNALGVAVTTTELSVEGIAGCGGLLIESIMQTILFISIRGLDFYHFSNNLTLIFRLIPILIP